MKDSYQEFCDQVLDRAPRATGREREAMRRELLDHLEDRALDMEARGWSTAEARQRAVACMGDPAEIGRAWDRQLSPLWLWVGRLARTAVVLLLLLLALLPAVARGRGVLLNLEARWGDLDGHRLGMGDAVQVWPLEERVEIGAYRLRFFQAALEAGAEGYGLRVRTAIYAADPLRDTSLIVLDGVEDSGWHTGGGSGYGGAVWYYDYYYPLGAARPDSVRMSAANDHGSFAVDFAIDWRDVP